MSAGVTQVYENLRVQVSTCSSIPVLRRRIR